MNGRLLAWLFACLPLPCCAADPWLAVRDVSLMVEPGSVLDFSAMLAPRGPADIRLGVGADGHLRLGERPARFLMASLGFATATGGFPDHASCDLYLQQLRASAYNMVRLDFVEDTLMQGRSGDFNFNPEQLDRFHYLLSSLKATGIYYLLNALSSDAGGYGDIAERWTGKGELKQRVYSDPAAQQHWRQLVEHMLGAPNPYTGISVLADPALAGLILVNENGLAFVTRAGAPQALRQQFASWLGKRYGDQAGLQRHWQGELRPQESLAAATVELSRPAEPNSKRMADTQRFFVALESSTAGWMTADLRRAGYRGLVTSYNNWLSPAAHLSRGQFDWVDLHHYFAEPSRFSLPGSVMRQDSMLAGGASYITELAAGRQTGRAFTVSEYGQVFWNSYRRETALALPAYASLQGWDMIAQHAGAITLSYAERGGRKDRIYPFMVGPDPIARANEKLAALLYLRADVQPARRSYRIEAGAPFVFEGNSLYGNIAPDLARLALVSRIGLELDGRSGGERFDGQFGVDDSRLRGVDGRARGSAAGGALATADGLLRRYVAPVLPQIGKVGVVRDQRLAWRVDALRQAGLLAADNRTDTAQGIYQSDTGQLLLETGRKRLSVITPLSEAVVFDRPERIALGDLTVEQADGPALVSVSSVDGAPLRQSKRMLVMLLTDARNSAMRFADDAATTLLELGHGPVLLRARTVRLTLRSEHAASLKVYAVNLRGARVERLAHSRSDAGIGVTLDTAALSGGPTTYFEITAEETR